MFCTDFTRDISPSPFVKNRQINLESTDRLSSHSDWRAEQYAFLIRQANSILRSQEATETEREIAQLQLFHFRELAEVQS